MKHHSYQDMILADKPIIYYQFKEQTGFGTIAYDLSGNGNHGTYSSGVVREQDSPIHDSDRSISVTGNQNVSIAKDLSAIIGGFSFEFWIRPTTIPVPLPQEYAAAVSFDEQETNFSVHLGLARPTFLIGGITRFAEANGYFTSGKWAHIIQVWEGSGGYINLYKDGIRLIHAGPYVGNLTVGVGTHYIGRWSTDLSLPWHGGIDDVSVYDYALTESQAQSHFLKGNLTSLFRRAKKAA